MLVCLNNLEDFILSLQHRLVCPDFNIFSKYRNLFTESIGAPVMVHESLIPSASKY